MDESLDILCTFAVSVCKENGTAFAGSLGEFGTLADDVRHEVFCIMAFQSVQGFFGQLKGLVECVDDNKNMFQQVAQVFLEVLEGFEEEAQSVEGEEVSEDGNNQIIGGDEGIKVKQAEGGGCVEDDEVIVGFELFEGGFKFKLASSHRHKEQVHRTHIEVRGDELQVRQGCFLDNGGEFGFFLEDVQECMRKVLAFEAEAFGGMSLGVQVHQEDAITHFGQAPGIGGGEGGFAGAAFEVEEELFSVTDGGWVEGEFGSQAPNFLWRPFGLPALGHQLTGLESKQGGSGFQVIAQRLHRAFLAKR